jgi:hypothetical protein
MSDAPTDMALHSPVIVRPSLPALILLALLAAARAVAQDAATVQLQQDVLELKRVNEQLERRIESLERQLVAQGGQAGWGSLPRSGSSATTNNAANVSWMNTADWDRIKPGMPELEVIRILGVPNSLRDGEQGRQVIFYALEIGTGRFLSGSVTLQEHRVAEVQKPTLK